VYYSLTSNFLYSSFSLFVVLRLLNFPIQFQDDEMNGQISVSLSSRRCVGSKRSVALSIIEFICRDADRPHVKQNFAQVASQRSKVKGFEGQQGRLG
jgi:hypothetical protein